MPIASRPLQSQVRALLSGSVHKSVFAGLILAVLLAAAGWSHADKAISVVEGVVVGVADGDTITVLDASQQQYKIRFAFIDAPEKAQPFGQVAKKSLSDKVYRQQVRVDILERDKYGRSVGRVWLGEQDINLSQLAEGYAWHYQYYARKTQSRDDFERYASAERQAREQHMGLWQDEAPTPPWNFRRARKTDRAASSASQQTGVEPNSPQPSETEADSGR